MLYALVVVYNRDIRDSVSFRRLSEHQDELRLMVFDNSEKDMGNRAHCEAAGCLYFSAGENIGLSKAYNYVTDRLKQSVGVFREEDYLLIFDDDTEIGEDYLDEASRLGEEAATDIFLPVVKSGEMVISPCVLKHGNVPGRIRSSEDLNCAELSGINSGMMVRLRVYYKVSYCEEMFLDFVDHDFLRQARDAGCTVAVMESCLRQSFSREQKSGDTDGVLRRYRSLKRDLKIYCERSGCRWYYLLHMGKFALRLTLRYRNLQFIRALFAG